jgi:hypothetical protein
MFGLVDAENVSVVKVHFLAPAVIVLIFLIASFSSAMSTDEGVGRPHPPTHSNLTVWLFVFALLTFVLRRRDLSSR